MKSVLKIFGMLMLAEVLTLFIDITLGFSGHILLRMICSFCTVSILAGLTGQAGYSISETDRKAHITPAKSRILILGFVSSVPYLLCWICLGLAKSAVINPEFYRIYKLICAPFLAVCNLFSDDVTALSLPLSGLISLGIVSFVPMAAFCISYSVTAKRRE